MSAYEESKHNTRKVVSCVAKPLLRNGGITENLYGNPDSYHLHHIWVGFELKSQTRTTTEIG